MTAAKLLSFLLFTFYFLLQLHFSACQNGVRGGYWSAGSQFPVSDIDSTLFTHLFCAFADLDSQTNRVTVSSANQAQFSTFTQTVRQKNPSVITLLSIGGGSSDSSAFASMASQASSRKSFIDSSVSLARSCGFHGLDLDWENLITDTETTNLGLLLNEWKAAIDSESTSTGNSTLLLTAALSRFSNNYTLDYPFQAIENSLDWINVMAYDFYFPRRSTVTGPPAALYNPGTVASGDFELRSWMQAGISSNKLVLGLPFYGYAWRLIDANNHGLFAPANGPAVSSDGDLGYGQIRNFISENNATEVYNATVVSNYCYSGTTWIGFDDTDSITAKVLYAKENGLLGYFAWHVGADDDNRTLSQAASETWGS